MCRVSQTQARVPLHLVERLADALHGVVVERAIRHGRQSAEQLGGEDEPLRHPFPLQGHLLEAETFETQGHLVVGAGAGLVDG